MCRRSYPLCAIIGIKKFSIIIFSCKMKDYWKRKNEMLVYCLLSFRRGGVVKSVSDFTNWTWSNLQPEVKNSFHTFWYSFHTSSPLYMSTIMSLGDTWKASSLGSHLQKGWSESAFLTLLQNILRVLQQRIPGLTVVPVWTFLKEISDFNILFCLWESISVNDNNDYDNANIDDDNNDDNKWW